MSRSVAAADKKKKLDAATDPLITLILPDILRFHKELQERRAKPYYGGLFGMTPKKLEDRNISDLDRICLKSYDKHFHTAAVEYRLFRANKKNNTVEENKTRLTHLGNFLDELGMALVSLGFTGDSCSKFTRLHKLVTADFEDINKGIDDKKDKLKSKNFERLRDAFSGAKSQIKPLLPNQEVEEVIEWINAVVGLQLMMEAAARMPNPPRGGGRKRSTRKRAGKGRATRRRRV